MKKIATIICSLALLLLSNTAMSQTAKTNEPAIDTKGAEKLKKEPEIKVAPDNRVTHQGKMQQETANQQQTQKTAEEEPVKAIKVEPRPAPVAQPRVEISTIDPNKMPPPRVKSKEPTTQKID